MNDVKVMTSYRSAIRWCVQYFSYNRHSSVYSVVRVSYLTFSHFLVTQNYLFGMAAHSGAEMGIKYVNVVEQILLKMGI